MPSSVRLSWWPALFAALLLSEAAHAQGTGAAYAPRRADVVAAPGGRPLAAAAATPENAVADVLRARGRQEATLSTVNRVDTRAGRAGAKHVRFEQTVDGLKVYGAYAKARSAKARAMGSRCW